MRPPESRLRFVFALLAAWFVCAPATALAREALDCPPRLSREVPALPPAQRTGLLWEVRGPDGAVGHLLGTIHLSNADVTTLSPALAAALDDSRRFGMEVLFDAPTLTTLAESMWARTGGGLVDLAEPALYARTITLLAVYGIDARTARTLKPWAAYTTLSLPPEQAGPPLDLELMTIAQQAGKPLFGLETLAEQLAIFEALSEADQLALLRETVCHYDALQRDLRALVAAYARRDLGALYRESLRHESPAQRRLMSTLLDERNARIAERLLPRYAESGTFVAVGALHLPGKGGLLERLTAAGFRVRLVEERNPASEGKMDTEEELN